MAESKASGKVIGIISVKGGVGKTTTVSNLGAALAHHFNKKVLLVDANFSAPNLGLHLGIVNPKHDLNDVLADDIPISQALLAHNSGFHILPASLREKAINPYKLRNRLHDLKKEYDFILIDSSPALNDETLSTILASDELLVVSAADHPTLSCTLRAINAAKDKKIPISGLIINKLRNKSFELSIDEIEKSTSAPVLAVLPDDIAVLESVARTIPLTIHKPTSPAAVEYYKLAACLSGEYRPDPRPMHRFMRTLIGSTPKQDINRGDYLKKLLYTKPNSSTPSPALAIMKNISLSKP